MFSLIRWAFSLVIFAIVLWFATNVQLGTRTLWGHMKAISGTKEAHEFAEGTKAEAKKVAEKLMADRDGGLAHDQKPAPKPLEDPSDRDRKKLDELTEPRPPKPPKPPKSPKSPKSPNR